MTFPKSTVALLLAAPFFAAETIPGGAPGAGLIVHEWGTFTSVAGADGESIPWTPLAGPADLPCFVIRSGLLVKAGAYVRVRMETPVIYFYTPRPATVSAAVDFRNGAITEWYPKAAQPVPGQLRWTDLRVAPDDNAALPETKAASHYFAARRTDSTMIRAGNQQEKMLFYRGIADFQSPVLPRLTAAGAVEIPQAVTAMLFENRGGRIGYRLVNGPAAVDPPELSGSLADLRVQLERILSGAGLYPKEAQAMLETWRDSWFEEGMRLFYLVPRDFVDRILPLEIAPQPREVARVFVGRIELLSPAMRETVGRAMSEGDTATLSRYGRFITAFAAQIPGSRERVAAFLQARNEEAARRFSSPACVQ